MDWNNEASRAVWYFFTPAKATLVTLFISLEIFLLVSVGDWRD